MDGKDPNKDKDNDKRGNLSQLEQDILAKNNGRGGGGGAGNDSDSQKPSASGRPGAVSVNTESSSGGGVGGGGATSHLSQMEQDIISKTQATRGREPSGVMSAASSSFAASAASNNSNLSRLEQDIAAKTQARGGNSAPASRPGAVSSSAYSTTSAGTGNLSQLEQDILTKTQASGGGGQSSVASRPGAGSASGSLSQLEQDIAAKSQSRGGQPAATRPGAVDGRLSQLEQDMAAKSSVRSGVASSAPGVVDVGVSGSSRLQQLERDVAAKTQARGASQPASMPGAMASGNGGNLTQLERDIAAKTQAASQMSSRSVAGYNPNATSGLSQLEQDMLAKTQARGGGGVPASRPGSVATGAPAAAGSFEASRDSDAKMAARSSQPPASHPGAMSAGGGGAALTRLEQDIMSKSSGAGGGSGGGGAATMPAMPSSSAAAPALTQLEQDLMSKTAGRDNERGSSAGSHHGSALPSNAGSSLRQLEDEVTAKHSATPYSQTYEPEPMAVEHYGSDYTQQFNALDSLEHNVVQKMHQPSVEYSAASSASASRNNAYDNHGDGSYFESHEVHLSDANNYSSPVASLHDPYDTRQAHHSSNFASAPAPAASMDSHDFYDTGGPGHSTNDFMGRNAYATADRSAPLSHVPLESTSMGLPSYAPGVTAADLYDDQDPEAPLYPLQSTGGSGAGGNEGGGIEAFVADKVVDATGVAVIMSDEEEEIEIKKRQKKFLILMAVGVAILLVAIIVPVALLTGGDAAVVPTAAPTMAPTLSPTMAPTTIEVPQMVAELADFSSVTDMEDRNSPQGKAVAWIVADEFVKREGLAPPNPKFLQRYALAVFYFAVGGDSWNFCHQNDNSCEEGWLKSTDECSWHLLKCNEQNGEKMIESMDFIEGQNEDYKKKGTALIGTMPKEIEHLTALRRLVIPEMEIGGAILERLGKLSSLVELSLSKCKFDGPIPETFGADHPMLKTLTLTGNSFTGTIPQSLSAMSTLTGLDLSTNQFQGSLPSFLGTLTGLELLSLGGNRFAGEIPLEFFNPHLQRLQLSGNALTGTIRPEVSLMTNLTHFEVGLSKMSGVLPTELFMLSTLQVLHLHNASFSGVLLSSEFEKLSELRDMWLQYNKFSGAIPVAAMERLEDLEQVFLHGNTLTGTISADVCKNRGYSEKQISMLTVPCVNVECSCCDCK